jgi:signal recognition particle subunit SRP54
MGDVLGLVERASEMVDQADAEKMAKKMAKGQFDLQDFADQMKQIGKMGSLSSILGMLPGGAKLQAAAGDAQLDPKLLARQVAIVSSMTLKERKNPDILKASRKKRIAAGAGVTVQDVNKLLKQFDDMSDMMKRMNKLGQKGLMRGGMGALMGQRQQPQGRRPF